MPLDQRTDLGSSPSHPQLGLAVPTLLIVDGPSIRSHRGPFIVGADVSSVTIHLRDAVSDHVRPPGIDQDATAAPTITNRVTHALMGESLLRSLATALLVEVERYLASTRPH